MTNQWTEISQTALLGLKATFRQDLKCTPSEQVYGQTIRLPADFFSFPYYDIHASDFIKSLKQFMTQLRSTPIRVQKQTRFFLLMDWMKCTHVFIFYDAVWAPVRPPYDAPLLVIDRTDKYYRVQKGRKYVEVSFDILKPGFTLVENI